MVSGYLPVMNIHAALFKCSLAILFAGMTLSAKDATKITTKSGAVKGALSADSGIRAFKGIPYAAPPVG